MRTFVSLLVILAAAIPEAMAAVPVRIGVPERGNIQYLTLWVALGAGYFQDEGLDAEVVFAPRANQSGQLLLKNEADIALLQPPVYLGLIAQQSPIVLFASLLANDPINLIVRADVAARLKLDPTAPLASRLWALKGLRVGVASEPPRRLRVLLAGAGMDIDRDIETMIIPGDAQIAAFTSGAVDALYTHTPFLEDAIVTHGAILLVNQSAGEVPALSNGQIHSLATTRAFAEAHPEVLMAATRAIARAACLLRTDPAAATQAVSQAGISAPIPAHLLRIVHLYGAAVPATPRVSAAAVERNLALYPARPIAPDFTRVRAADFLAPAFADEAAANRAGRPTLAPSSPMPVC